MYKTRADRASCSLEAAGRDEDRDKVMRVHRCTAAFGAERQPECVYGSLCCTIRLVTQGHWGHVIGDNMKSPGLFSQRAKLRLKVSSFLLIAS